MAALIGAAEAAFAGASQSGPPSGAAVSVVSSRALILNTGVNGAAKPGLT